MNFYSIGDNLCRLFSSQTVALGWVLLAEGHFVTNKKCHRLA
jgi:hypothetical protein